MSLPLISVIVPVYNRISTLEKCVESILNTSGNLELILIDDGSKDGSDILCDTLSKKDPRIVFIKQPQNKGVSAARNAGIKAAKGEYIGFADSDDYVEQDIYAKMLDRIQTTGSRICVCGYSDHYGSKVVNICPDSEKTVSLSEFKLAITEDEATNGFMFNKLYESTLVKEHFFSESLSMCEDLAYNIELKSDSPCNVSYCKEALYNYIHTSESATGNHHFIKDDTFVYKPAFDYLQSSVEDKSLKKALSGKYLKILKHSFRLLLGDSVKAEPDRVDYPQLKRLKKEMRRNFPHFFTSKLPFKTVLSLIKTAFVPTGLLLKIKKRK